ncbi:MAG: hypothetical protein AMJ43_07310 [Coxiella sp. DG_40]|nr:MAG: hypothetical protein AMJ43_07310 [Coxiella sp. DG_40]
MVRRTYTPEQIINELREAEIHINQGIPIAEAGRKIGVTEAKVLIEQWKREYNQVSSHSLLGYRPPAPEGRVQVTLT